MGGGATPLYLKFWAKLTTLEQKRRFSIDIVAPQPQHLAKESSIITNTLSNEAKMKSVRFP